MEEKPFEWEKMSTRGAHHMSDQHLLEVIKILPLVGMFGFGVIAELCKRFKTYIGGPDSQIESITSLTDSYTVKHDKNKKCITILYTPMIRDYRKLYKKHGTVFDARVGEICQFIMEEFKTYSDHKSVVPPAQNLKENLGGKE